MGVKIPPVKLEMDGDIVLVEHRILLYGLRKLVGKALDCLTFNRCLESVASSKWHKPIVTLLKAVGKIPRMGGD